MLLITKSASVAYTTVGSTITYTLNVTNNGAINLFDISISDALSSELKFISNSVKINGFSSPLDSIISGVSLGVLNAGKSATITFDTEVVSLPVSGTISNTAIGEFSYIDPKTSTKKFGSTTSNTFTLGVSLVKLEVLKMADKTVVSVGDTVTYTVTLANTGNVDLFNIQFTDQLPQGLQLINRTFTINGVVINSVDLSSGVIIPSIPAGSVTLITYQVKVISTSNCVAINEASAKYKYVLPDGTTGSGESSPTPESMYVLKTNISNFKQFSVEEYLNIPCQKPDMESLNHISGRVDIVKTSVIRTGASTSREGQTLTNYKLVIQGVLHLVVEYVACTSMQDVHSAHFNVPFSTFIVLPIDFTPGCKIEVYGDIEDIYAKEMDARRFFTNTTMLISAKL